jgi:glycosyltransferase involved in cell wall biosynthesis
MRVLLISHNIVRGDGQGRVNLELARHCLAEGHQVTLIADRADASLIEQGVTWLPIHPLLKRPDLVKTPLFAFRANGVVRRVRHAFDLIVGNGYVLTEKHHVSLCQFVHGAQGNTAREQLSLLRPRSWYRSAYTGFNAIQEKKSYESASVIVACSHAVQQELIAIGVPQDRIRVIHNGVDTEEFRPGPADAAALGLPPTRPLALFVGDIRSGRKNLDAVLRALPSVQNLELVVVGALPGSPYPAMARRLGIDKRVKNLSYRSDVANRRSTALVPRHPPPRPQPLARLCGPRLIGISIEVESVFRNKGRGAPWGLAGFDAIAGRVTIQRPQRIALQLTSKPIQ